jgi:hypothetical protein
MNEFRFNIKILNEFIHKRKKETDITCKEIYDIICKSYGIVLPKKIYVHKFISIMCRDSLRFKNIDDKYISKFIDITISLFLLKKLTNTDKSDIKEQLVNLINKTMSDL